MFTDQPLAGNNLSKTNVKHSELTSSTLDVVQWSSPSSVTWPGPVRVKTTLELSLREQTGSILIENSEYSKPKHSKITLVNKGTERMWKETISTQFKVPPYPSTHKEGLRKITK